MLVTVSDPQTSTARFRAVTTYAVTTTHPDGSVTTVRRRYSDWEVVYAQMRTRYVGCLLPQLPGKKFLGNNRAEFLVVRMRRLGIFMSRVAEHPFLARDGMLREFLTAEPAAWENIKANPDVLQSEGEALWKAAVDELELPADMESSITITLAELQLLERHLRSAQAAVKYMTDAARQLAHGAGELRAAFFRWSDFEAREVSALGSRDNVGQSAPAMLTHATDLMTGQQAQYELFPESVAVLFGETLGYELQCLTHARAMLKHRETLVPAVAAAQKQLATLEASDGVQWDAVKAARDNVEHRKGVLAAYTKGVMLISLEGYVVDRVCALRRMLGELAVLLESVGLASAGVARRFMAEAGLPAPELRRSANAVLGDLGLALLPSSDSGGSAPVSGPPPLPRSPSVADSPMAGAGDADGGGAAPPPLPTPAPPPPMPPPAARPARRGTAPPSTNGRAGLLDAISGFNKGDLAAAPASAGASAGAGASAAAPDPANPMLSEIMRRQAAIEAQRPRNESGADESEWM